MRLTNCLTPHPGPLPVEGRGRTSSSPLFQCERTVAVAFAGLAEDDIGGFEEFGQGLAFLIDQRVANAEADEEFVGLIPSLWLSVWAGRSSSNCRKRLAFI